MVELKNVSKFYYSKNTVASGFAKVNLKLDIGEFVAITGESGSGKSTILNVISGLDSYEEGEMYINGEETSGYSEKDFEEYRKKYIGNIFQNFNLVNSYTVYQNIELVLLINGYKKHQVKKKIIETLKKVDLMKYKNTKVSKLSGGQKQRVAIARALVKETPIIVADEPTGNLDSKTAENIIELLKEISKDKLIIIVTHNYEQVEKYVTRKITMHDGRIIEDKKIHVEEKKKKLDKVSKAKVEEVKNVKEIQKSTECINQELKQNKKKKLSNANKVLLGIRNTFNIKIKFVLLLAVYLFVSVSVVAGYSSLKKQEYEESNTGYNNYFIDTSDKRIIVKKNDLTEFTAEDYAKIRLLDNVDYVVENDLQIDQYITFQVSQSGMVAQANNINNFIGNIDIGEAPQNDYEIVVSLVKDNYYMGGEPSDLVGQKVKLLNGTSGNQISENEVTVTGISYREASDEDGNNQYVNKIYLSNVVIDEIRQSINKSNATLEIEFNDKILASNNYTTQYKIIENSNVPYGESYVSEDMNYLTKKNNCLKYNMNINVDNLYYKDSMSVTITKTYNKNNIKRLLSIDEFDKYNGAIFVNPDQYNQMFKKGNYQSSVYVKDEKEVRTTLEQLNNINLKALYVKDATIDGMGEARVFVNTFRIVVTTIVMVILFFISYFVIKIIMKSRNVYFSTIRILGATRRNANQLLRIELCTVLNLAYVITLGLIALINENVIKLKYLQSMLTYLNIPDLCILYLILIIISLLISARYSKQLFKKSAMNTYRDEEV